MSTRTRSRKPASQVVPAVSDNPLRKSLVVKAQSTTVEVPAGKTAVLLTPEEMSLFEAFAGIQDLVPYLKIAVSDFGSKIPARANMAAVGRKTYNLLAGMDKTSLEALKNDMFNALVAIQDALEA